MNSAIWGLIGVGVGGIIQICSEGLRSRSASRLSLSQREHEIRVGRDDFQRRNLLEIQEGVARWVRAEARIQLFDREQLATLGNMAQRPAHLSNESFESGRQLSFKIERVTNNDLRTTLKELTKRASELQVSRLMKHETSTVHDIDADMNQQVNQYVTVIEKLGETLRQYL